MIEGVNWDRLCETLGRDEGCDLSRHEVKGVDHIGYGFNLETPWPDALLEFLNVEDEDDIKIITKSQADHLLAEFLQVAVNDSITVYGEYVWGQLSPIRREVLINVSYNLGLNRLQGFRRMNAAIKNFDFSGASMEMLDSKAAKQDAPDRYKRLATALESNTEAGLELKHAYDAPVVDAPPHGTATDDDVVGQELGTKPTQKALGGFDLDISELSDAELFGLFGKISNELANRVAEKPERKEVPLQDTP